MGKVFAISGCTNSGKTTLAERIREIIGEEKTTIIHQDDYFMESDKVEKLYMTVDGKDVTERGFFYSYDEKESVDIQKMAEAIQQASEEFENVIIEGNMLTEMEEVLELCDKVLILTLDFKTCKSRRELRTYDPPDDIGYFEYVAWPAYQRHLKKALEIGRNDDRFTVIDVSAINEDDVKKSIDAYLFDILNNHVRISNGKLDVRKCQKLASSPSCGAISIFIGTTRDNFEDKKVQTLSYDCYDEMAYKELRNICSTIRQEIPSVKKIVIEHRIGNVEVEEESVIIVTSSPHRVEAIKATEMAIELLKKNVPIWKKEVYENDEFQWKSNSDKKNNSDNLLKTCDNWNIDVLKFFE